MGYSPSGNASTSLNSSDDNTPPTHGTISGMRPRLAAIPFLLSLMLGLACTIAKERPARAFAEATGGEALERIFWKEFVVTYTITLNGTAAGQPLPSGPQHMMTVWHEHKSGWMVIAHSVSM